MLCSLLRHFYIYFNYLLLYINITCRRQYLIIMNAEGNQPLLPVECEAFCQSLQTYKIADVGSGR